MVEPIQPPPGLERGPANTGAAGASELPASEPPAAAPLPPPARIEGYIDGVQDRRVVGWAWCRSRPADPVEVEIRVDGKAVATVRADRFRPDLAKAGLSEGRHGFEAMLECALSAEDKARLAAQARIRAGEPWVPLVNRTTHPARIAGPAEGASAPALSPGETQAVLGAIAALDKTVGQSFGRLRAELQAAIAGKGAAQASAPNSAADADAQAWRDQLTTLVGSVDVLQTRLDAICAALQEGGSRTALSRRGDRTLMFVVTALGAVSCASLLLGLFAAFG
jgi:hypothetical protein